MNSWAWQRLPWGWAGAELGGVCGSLYTHDVLDAVELPDPSQRFVRHQTPEKQMTGSTDTFRGTF
jgi:hypothetical protein